MSSWGKLDSKQLTGNVRVVNGSANVTNTAGQVTLFTTEVKAGDYFVAGAVTGNSNVKYYVSSVSGNTITLSTPYEGSNANVQANIQQGPKWINIVSNRSYGNVNANAYTIQKIYGVDATEANIAGNKANGFSHTGWTHQVRYTDAYGRTRIKSEVVVAMSKNFNRDNTNTSNTFIQFSGNLLADAQDDLVIRDAQ